MDPLASFTPLTRTAVPFAMSRHSPSSNLVVADVTTFVAATVKAIAGHVPDSVDT